MLVEHSSATDDNDRDDHDDGSRLKEIAFCPRKPSFTRNTRSGSPFSCNEIIAAGAVDYPACLAK